MDIDGVRKIQIKIASEMRTLAQYITQTGLCGNDDISPFCHDALYRSAMIYARVLQVSDEADAQNGLDDIKESLKINTRRWRAAGN